MKNKFLVGAVLGLTFLVASCTCKTVPNDESVNDTIIVDTLAVEVDTTVIELDTVK